MNKQNKNLILVTLLIFIIAISAPKLVDLTGRAIQDGDTCTDTNNIGDRVDGLYCGLDEKWHEQKFDGEECLNNFECSEGALCQGGICQIDLIDLLSEDPDPEDDTVPASSSTGSSGGSGGGSSSPDWRGAAGTCVSNWTCTTWSACLGGKKTRKCIDINDCDNEPPIYSKPAEEMLCTKLIIPTCSDGIKNQREEGVDCGGPCEICNTCFDNQQNCHKGDCELGLDCGGPCMPCKHALSIILVIITIIILIVLTILGIWYWRIKKSTQLVGETVEEVTGKKLNKTSKSFRL